METMQKDEVVEDSKPRDNVNLRREARRRKILENAKNRLEKLNGRGSGGDHDQQQIAAPKVDQNDEFSDPEVEPDVILPEREKQVPAFNPDFNEILATLSQQSSTLSPRKQMLLDSRIHILLAAVISYVIALTVNDGTGAGFSIFIPAGLFVALELTYFREQHKINPMTALIITICGFRSPKTRRLLQVLSTIQGLIVDTGILVFFFGIITFVLSFANDRFLNLVTIK